MSMRRGFMASGISRLSAMLSRPFSKAAPFVFFAAMTAIQFFVVLLVYPETKGVSLEDLQKKLVAVLL